MEVLNALLNDALGTESESYIGIDGIKKCYNALEKLSKEDKAALIVFLYFFPNDSSSEKNTESFWFIKYEKEKNYNEYEFAKDLLKIYSQYTKEKNYESFESKILEKIKLFKNSKLIGDFLSILEEFDERILAIISYITKDPSYFEDAFELFISSGKIQTFSFIKNARNYLTKRKLVLDLKKGLHLIGIYSNELEEVKSSNKKLTNELEEVKSSNKNLTNKIIGLEDENSGLKNNNKRLMNVALDLEKAVSNLEKDNAKLKNNISVLKNNISVLNKKVGDLQINNNKMEGEIKALKKDSIEKEKKIGEMNERLEQIDLRDTVKLSIRYLYKVFLSKFPSEVNFTEKIWEQIDEVKKILSKPEFKDFCFIPEFIDMITFDKLAHFNHIAHDSTKKKRNFKNIKKYMQKYSNFDLEKVTSFLENLPHINEFINLNLLFYLDQGKVDAEFQKTITYADIYKTIFETKKEEEKKSD